MAVSIGAFAAAASDPGAKDAKRQVGWAEKAEFSYVLTSGNAETNTFSLKNVTRRSWTERSFELRLEGLRVLGEETTR